MADKSDDITTRWMFLDLETDIDGRVFKLAALHDGTEISTTGPDCLAKARPALDRMASHAVGVAGHNIVDHDLPVLGRLAPDLALLKLPVADTLLLSPVCFPENPYHRLVKDYKLVPQSKNDPLLDARLASILLKDETASLQDLFARAPEIINPIDAALAQSIDQRVAKGWRLLTAAHAANRNRAPDIKNACADHVCATALNHWTWSDDVRDEQRWALAYALSWLRVSGARSVLPPWVRHRFPETATLLSTLRDTPCDHPDCHYCAETFNPETQLKKFFGFDAFRAEPPAPDGSSLQRSVVQAGMRNESLLAILPTGGGKSLCFQLPALTRNVRLGQLTVVVSPLQALMKDQVDGLIRRTGMDNAAALHGMLTLPERGDVLRRTAMGDLAILYVSPEQLRNVSVRKALANRDIGCWVMDEAHCLSKWGHDFRTDYLFVGRFMRMLAEAQQAPLPPVACFTATAKPDVVGEIIEYFKRETGHELARYQGGVERDNLRFEVQTVGAHGRLPRIDELLRERLGEPGRENGCAVVFRTTRALAEESDQFLRERGWASAAFHAGLTPPEKRRIQEAFLAGDVQVICATNAFGMGIDKDNVRAVIHGDTPGSLENYLQEAGRAGRDREQADCILLYSEEDCERQFRLGAYSELSRNDIAQILRGLRKAARQRSTDEVVITTGELLRDEDVETGFEADDRMADTKVRTAISWLERAGLIERNENQTHVIQAKPLVQSMEEAEKKIAAMELSAGQAAMWLAILRELMDADRNESITVDEIALLPEFRGYLQHREGAPSHVIREGRSVEYVSAKVLNILHTMMQTGILKKDTLLTAYVSYKVADHSVVRLQGALAADQALIALMAELEPDPEHWLPLNARLISAEMEARGVASSPELVRKLLRSMSEDGRGFGGQSGSIDLRSVARDQYRVRIKRSWTQVAELADRRGRIARALLDALMQKIPPGTAARKDVLVSFSFEEMVDALMRDLVLRAEVREPLAAVERGLMFLHEQGVIVLQQGLSIFRSAMAIKVLPDMVAQRYTKENYEALELHYKERIFQVHVMNAYAQAALRKIDEALRLVVSYFSVPREVFITLFFRGQRGLIELATTERSYRTIVDALNNKDQIRIVTASPRRNMLILAGPGAGKTRVVVHRVAYLLRVRRVKPSAILVCCFNHKAAAELRSRLAALVGADARGVIVSTYHGLALRLLGKSARQWAESTENAPPDFDRMMTDAVALLKEETVPPGMEPDDIRDRLLAGFEHILVDEYQDIDEPQYELVSAIAGRTIDDTDRKLTVLAVGDDDQNIYTFRGANVGFIRRFQEDYGAEAAYLVENYRSTRYIIEAANQVIARNRDRMKTAHPIRIDQGRGLLHPGGVFGAADPETRGRVAVVSVPGMRGQAASMIREMQRLRSLGVKRWDHIAVLARHRQDLALVRAAAEAAGIPVSWSLDRQKVPPLHRLREVRAFIDSLSTLRGEALNVRQLDAMIPRNTNNPWIRLLREWLNEWRSEAGDEPVSAPVIVDHLYESLSQRRRDETWGDGIVLRTVHAAKGTEYPHVLLGGDWSMSNADSREEERRAFYVGMTRARDSLSVSVRKDVRHPFAGELSGPSVIAREEAMSLDEGVIARDYALLGLEDIFIDYAGVRHSTNAVHNHLAALHPGDEVTLSRSEYTVNIATKDGHVIGRLSAKAASEWRDKLASIQRVQVMGIIVRTANDVDGQEYKDRLRARRWEAPWLEVTRMRD